MIGKQDVQHVAKLARLGLTKKEEEKFASELSSILDYIGQLKKINITGVKPTSHSISVENVMREDEARSTKSEARRRIIEQVPDTKDGYIKVKSIF